MVTPWWIFCATAVSIERLTFEPRGAPRQTAGRLGSDGIRLRTAERSTRGEGMTYTADWSIVREYWPQMFDARGMRGRAGLRFLEIGCFEGMASVWLLDHVLTDESSRLVVVDTFEGSWEHFGLELRGLRDRFEENVAPWRDRVEVIEGRSFDVLCRLNAEQTELFDFVYVDASHYAADVLADAVLAWPLLRPGGLLCFDDYLWREEDGAPPLETPRIGVDCFVRTHSDELVIRHNAYQFAVEKTSPDAVGAA